MTLRLSALIFALFTLEMCAARSPQDAHYEGTPLQPIAAPNFTLTDDVGHAWSLAGQHGRTVALFFGYTHCTDTCPVTLAKLAQASSNERAEIAFVTVDPNRDVPVVMHHYISHFPGGPIVGLTGTPSEIAQVERAYHVWAQRIPGRHLREDDYDQAHSSAIYIIDGDGRERVVHDDTDSIQSFASDFQTLAR